MTQTPYKGTNTRKSRDDILEFYPIFALIQPNPEIYVQVCHPYPKEARIHGILARIKPDIFAMCPNCLFN